MAEKATMKTRKELIARHKANYHKYSKNGKGLILDSLSMAIGLSRSRIKHLLLGGTSALRRIPKLKRGQKTVYDGKFFSVLKHVWTVMDFPSGRRLVAGMKDMLEALIRFNEIIVDNDTIDKLNEVSASTADRLLKRTKKQMQLKGPVTTKPGTLLKRGIPMRLGTQWDDAVPGYEEIDLVAHCGASAAGDYANTLDVTDICTGWTETQAVINKAQKHVFAALIDIAGRQPFPIRGIDSDNGSEFINNELYRYCRERGICFTRSRPYQKNDNCHVEQKNWHIIRRNIGYNRYEGSVAVLNLNRYYSLLRLYTNFFLPQTKLIEKRRDGARIRKRYDTPQTPYQRVLLSEHISNDTKEKLKALYATLNPAELKRAMIKQLEKLEKLSKPF